MKRPLYCLLVFVLVFCVGACRIHPSPHSVSTKADAYTRSYASITLPPTFSYSFRTTLSDNSSILLCYEDSSNAASLFFSQFDPSTQSETALYQIEHSSSNTEPFVTDVTWVGAGTLWLTKTSVGDLAEGGSIPSRFILQAINVNTNSVLHEWDLSDRPYHQNILFAACNENEAYLLCDYLDVSSSGSKRQYFLLYVNAADGVISDPYTIDYFRTPEIPLITLNDGRMALINKDAHMVIPFAKGTVTPESPLSFPTELDTECFFNGTGDHPFVFVFDNVLYGKDATPLIDFAQWGVNFTADTLRDITLQDGVCRVLVEEFDQLGVYTLTPCTAAEAAPTLRIAGYAVGDGIHAAASAFNRTRFDYTARVIDYRQYDDNPNALYPDKAGVTKLNTELLAGGDFDVLYLNDYLSSAALARQGGLLDLYPLLDAGDKVTRDTFVPSILEKTETDGHLYSLSTAFGIRTLLSDRRVIGEYPTLSIADWNALEAADPDRDVTDMAEETFMYYLSDIAVHDFIKDGTAQFNTDTFIAYLETMATLPNVDELWEQLLEDLPVADYATIADGTFLLMPLYLRNLSFYQRTLCNLADGAQFTGYPTENGVGHVMEFADTLGIFAATDKKDAAWDFLRLTVTENRLGLSEGGLEQPGFPTDRASFEAQLDHYRDPSNFVDMSGAPATTFEGAPLRALTEEDIDRLYDIIDAAKPLVQADRAIVDILEDEASYFLKGEATAADTAARIGQRVQLYLDEQQ